MAGFTRGARKRRPAALDLEDSIDLLASLMRGASHVVFVTGAGLSTNAGIRDYRGPDGIWTEALAKGLVAGEPGSRANEATPPPWDPAMYRLLPAAAPTLAHRAIALLVARGRVAHVITQNEDALHLRAGLDPGRLSELHGNAFVEVCGGYASGDSDGDMGDADSSSSSSDDDDDAGARARDRKRRPAGCGAAVVRDFVCYHGDTYAKANAAGRHVTRRACPRCRPLAPDAPPGAAAAGRGWLLDSTVDFGESPGGFPWGRRNTVHNVDAAKESMRRVDLVVAWGTSLSILANYFDPWDRASKWARKPLRLARGKKCALAIVSRGRTFDEDLAALKIDDDVDAIFAGLLARLDLPTPPPYDFDADPFVRTAVPCTHDAPWTFATARADRLAGQVAGRAAADK